MLLNYKIKNLSQKKISSYASGTSSKKRSSNRLEIEQNSSEERSTANQQIKRNTNSVEEKQIDQETLREEDTLYSNRQFGYRDIS